jgi:hypothetical protein
VRCPGNAYASPEITAARLLARERVLLFCIATNTDWTEAGVTEAVLQVAMVIDLIERVPPHRYVLTKLGREVCGVLLERAGIKLAKTDGP